MSVAAASLLAGAVVAAVVAGAAHAPGPDRVASSNAFASIDCRGTVGARHIVCAARGEGRVRCLGPHRRERLTLPIVVLAVLPHWALSAALLPSAAPPGAAVATAAATGAATLSSPVPVHATPEARSRRSSGGALLLCRHGGPWRYVELSRWGRRSLGL